jgi:uracil-DNA glycosylase
MKSSRSNKEKIQDVLDDAANSLEHAKKYRRMVDLSTEALDAARKVVDNKMPTPAPETGNQKIISLSSQEIFGSSPNSLGGALEEIRTTLGDCTRCKLHSTRNKIVFGDGNPGAELMFIGEAPGADEDAQGIPFVGRAGKLLTKMIEAMGVTRKDVYIANIIKCRPPGNRDPEVDEVKACKPFLLAQIEAIKPKVICTLGNPSTKSLLNTKTGIFKMRGRFHDFAGIPLIPTFHPAFLLRSPGHKKETWEDLQAVMAKLGWRLPETGEK